MNFDQAYIGTMMLESDLNALTLNNDQVERLIIQASNEVDSYLRVRYLFPYEYETNSIAESELLRMKFVCFKYWLYAGKYDGEEMKAVQVQYSDVLKRLSLISTGKNDLPGMVLINNIPGGVFKTGRHVHHVFHPGRLKYYDN
jgi:phage gp36-like protein